MNNKEQLICQKLYEENNKRIKWYLWRHYGWLDEDCVYDIMQEVWKEMCVHIGKVSSYPEEGRWAWLVTVTNSKVVSFIRANARKEELVERVQNYSKRLPETNPVQEMAIQKMLAESVMEKLSAEEKRTLFGKYLGLRKIKDNEDRISCADKKSDNAQTCKMYRARKKLLKHMKEGGLNG